MNLLIPLKTSETHGFEDRDFQQSRHILGHVLRFIQQKPYFYIELREIEMQSASKLLEKIRNFVGWASVRLDISILIEEAPGRDEIPVEKGSYFQCLGPTMYEGTANGFIRTALRHQTIEGSGRLLSALTEGEQIPQLADDLESRKLKTALEIFSFVDFEVSTNARFLTLVTILEILSAPAPRRHECNVILENAMTEMQKLSTSTDDADLEEALQRMHQSAHNWKKDSITSSIRRLAEDVSKALGDTDAVNAVDALGLYTGNEAI